MKSIFCFGLCILIFALVNIDVVNANQLSDYCMYRDPSNANIRIGVDRNRQPYIFDFSTTDNPDPEPYGNRVHNNFSTETMNSAEYKAGSSFSGAGNCPTTLTIYTMQSGDVYSQIASSRCLDFASSGTAGAGDIAIMNDDCPFVLDNTTLNSFTCSHAPGAPMSGLSLSFSGALEHCRDQCRESGTTLSDCNTVSVQTINNSTSNFTTANWSRMATEDVQDLDEQAAREERIATMNALISCWDEHHPTIHQNCRQTCGEEFDDCILGCVREQAGSDYRCGGEHTNYERARNNLFDARSAKWIEVNLIELTCEQLLGEFNSEMRQFLVRLYYILIAVAFSILVVMSSLDYAKAVSSGSEDSDVLKKANTKVMKRMGIFLLIVILPTILIFLFDSAIFGDILGIYENCIDELF